MSPQLRSLRSPTRRFQLETERETEIIGPIDTRTCVTNTGAMPFRFICSLEVGGKSCCSGTLIGPRTVLTAGHCLVNLCLRPGLAPSAMRAIPGRNGGASLREPFGSSSLAGLQLAPGFNAPGFGNGSARDYGVAILKDPVGNSSGWWTFNFFRTPGDPVGTSIVPNDESLPNASISIELSGYPCDHPQRTHRGGRPDRCFRPGIPKGTIQYHDRNGLAGVGTDGILEYFNDTFNCMSGSPVWMQTASGGRTMIGVHISANRPPDPPVANRGVLIQGPVRELIRAHSFSPPGTTPPPRPTVKLGSKGATVQELQYRLNVFLLTAPGVGQARLKVDGIFGAKTLAATRAFQRAMGLVVDGIVGPQTWRRLQLPF